MRSTTEIASIDRSINPINRSINQARNHVIIQSFNHSIDKPAAQHVSNPSVQSIQPSINQPDRLINQSESIVGLWNRRLLRRSSFLAISRKGFSKSAHFVRVQKILLEVHKSQAISRKAFAKSAHFVVLQKCFCTSAKLPLAGLQNQAFLAGCRFNPDARHAQGHTTSHDCFCWLRCGESARERK
eukprot:COSAG06_NODE_5693_length_3315_cov_330.218216_4_plen_185_part_00